MNGNGGTPTQFFAWCFAFVQVGFKTARPFLVILALLVHSHRVPCGKVFHAEPIQGRLNVGQELPLLPGQVLDRFGGQVAGDAG